MEAPARARIEWQACESLGLVRVHVGRPVSAYVTGPVVSYYMHWSDSERRTLPCFITSCPHCLAGHSRRALSYTRIMAAAWCESGTKWEARILELPFAVGKRLSPFIGKVLAFRRDKRFGPVMFGKFLFEQNPPRPIMFPLVESLMRMWRVNPDRQLALVGNSAMLAHGLAGVEEPAPMD